VKARTGAVLLAMAAAFFTACGGGSDDESSTAGGAEAPAGDKIVVSGKEFSYDPAALTLKAGQPSTIVLKNIGSIEHDITIDKARFTLTVPGKKTQEKVLNVETPGTYEFYCSLPGHKSAGMKGELTVT
jgi:uncharacterized cupredoxin-like copper-binding protein